MAMRGRQQRHILLLTVSSAINGGLVAAIGPSIDAFAASTGMDHEQISAVVVQNRLAKLLGLVLWTAYAHRLQRGRRVPVSPRALVVLVMLSETILARLLAHVRTSKGTLRFALVSFGLCYGVTDSAAMQLALWCGGGSSKDRRAAIATVSAGFTAGAFLTPMVMAVALADGSASNDGAYAGFDALAVLALAAAVAMACAAPLPGPSAADGATREAEGASGAEHERASLTAADEEAEHEAADADTPSGKGWPSGAGGESARRRRAHGADESGAEATLEPKAAPLPRARELAVIGNLALVLFCVTSTEHACATWLPVFGSKVGGLSMATMALVSSAYWGAIAFGRAGWSFVATRLKTAWPVLFLDGILMLASSSCLIVYASGAAPGAHPALLWAGAVGVGLGIASAFPCAMTLPAEAHVQLTPTVMMALNLMGSAGEMAGPAVLGRAFGAGWFGALGGWVALLQLVVLGASAVAYAAARRPASARPGGRVDSCES